MRLRNAFKLALSLLVLWAASAVAQNTAVTLQVTDTPDAQTWNNGTYIASLVTPPGQTPFGPPFNFIPAFGGGTVPNQLQTGSLSTVGGASLTLASNANVAPAGSQWRFTVCSQATAPCFVQLVTIAGGSQTVTLTPPSIRINGANSPPTTLAYTDAEIQNPSIGTIYFNLTTLVSRQFNGTSWSNITGGTSSIVQTGLIAEYRFTEGSGTSLIDFSGSGNTGTLGAGGNAPTWLTTGLQFSGNQFVTLPNALYAAKTIQIFFTYQPLTTPSQLFPTIFVNQNSQFGIFMWSKAQDYAKAAHDGAYLFRSRTGAGFKTSSRAGIVGSGLFTITMGGTDAMYINGTSLDFAEGTAGAGDSSGAMSSGNLQLGGSGTAFAGNTFFTGNISYVVAYNRALTAAEVDLNSATILSVMASRNVPAQSGSSSTTNQIVADGDSITEAQNFGASFTAWTKNIFLNGTWNITNVGSTGMYISTNPSPLPQCPLIAGQFCGLQGDGPLVVDSVSTTHSPNTAIIIWAGTNDMAGGVTAANASGQLATYCRQRHLLGAKCVVVTMMSRTGQDANKNTYDALIRSNWAGYADAIADVASDPSLGADGANASAVFFQADHIHPTSAASLNNIAPIIQRAINRVYGNVDFSTATTYTTTAPAATATTAGTESTNTVTITFGATPTNCIQGSTITIAAATPAGYNGNFQVLTRSATQVTYFNATSGLGPITVQGTGICPLQADVDTYAILGGSAVTPNYSLESCLGYTGQSIYLKNTNTTSPWTVTPFVNTETIDGATTLTMPTATSGNNPVVILQSKLISSAAGGCTWQRVQ